MYCFENSKNPGIMLMIKNRIEVIKGDITKITVDAIVNAANSSLLGGGGVDGAIHRAGGPAILNDCMKIIRRQGGCATGDSVITSAGNLPAKFVIHTVGPVWNGGKNNEGYKLENCYRNSLQLSTDNGCRTIAFPAISTGIYRFPKNEAAKIAVNTICRFLSGTDKIDKVILVCFENDYYMLVNDEIKKIE
jgi:O-acetyl-ADP-ribose deacetylase (regulator of RNase III)